MSRSASNVFLNVPFDLSYEPYFVSLITSVVALGRIPRTVLELPEHGSGRLSRLLRHIRMCDVSIHDLSRVGVPARFNMPFELGLACAVSDHDGIHAYILLERQAYRLDRTLSDIKGREAYIYDASRRRLITCVLDALRRVSGPSIDPRDVMAISTEVRRLTPAIKRQYAAHTLFTRSVFLELVAVATAFCVDAELIK